MVAKTSKMAYEELVASGKASTQRAVILKTLLDHPNGYTRRELSRVTGLEINAVCGRVNEILKYGWADDSMEVACPTTRKLVTVVRPIVSDQMDMF